MATGKPGDTATSHEPSRRKEDDLTHQLDDAALLAKADELAAVAESMRAKDAVGADRAAAAAQVIRDHVSRRALARAEADNYARNNAPHQIETEE
jgi:hypothetical protein